MEVEDEVVEEVDVYLNKTISSNLHIFQFWSTSSPIAEQTDIEVKARPNHRMFEIESQIDTKSKNFDERKSQLFGHYLETNESKDPKKGKDNDIKRLDRQVLKSVEVKPTLNQYCIAVIRDDCPELHLNPIQSVIQFKPKLNYLDNKSDPTSSKSKTGSKGEESDADLSSQDEGEAQTITMRFAGPDEDKWRKARERSFAFYQQQVAKDQWIGVNCHSIDSQMSSQHRLSLIYNSSEANDSGVNDDNSSISSLQEFLSKIKCSEDTQNGTIAQTSDRKTTGLPVKLCLSQIRSLPFTEQVRHLLINAKLLSFDQIMSLLLGDFDPNSVLKSIQNYGLLVRGNWVVKSEILYNKEQCTRSQVTGIPIELLCRSRDYIIWRFTQTNAMLKKDIFSCGRSRIPDEDVVDILKQFSVFDPKTKMWTFLLSEDTNFLSKYPEVVQRQQLLWSNRYMSLERAYSSGNAVVKTEVDVSVKTPQRKRRNSRRGSTNSISADDNEVIETLNSDQNLDSNTDSLFCNPNKLKKERKSPVKAINNRKMSAPSGPTIKERRRSKSPKVAVFEINPTVALYPTPEERKELVKYISDKLKTGFCMTSADLRKYVSENTSNKLWFDVSEEVIESAVNESGGFKVQNKWPQNSSQQPLYALTKFGDNLDDFRKTLIEMFSDQTRVRVTAFTEKVRDKQLMGEKNCENTCLKLLKDYCIYKSSLYYLKGTVSPN